MSFDFKQKYNPMSGQNEWQMQCFESDEWQSVARSAYADMVNDWHRNQLYHKAIKKAVHQLKTRNKPILGLDIGTGSGLLSMMAVKSGADRVVACDSFGPIAECAKKIVHKNGFSQRIDIFNKRSDELSVGTNGHLVRKADLLVAELYDTELIGEGAIPTYRHAVQNLLESDAILVPSRARIYCQLAQSESLFAYHQFIGEFKINDSLSVQTPEEVIQCKGSHVLHDLQINELKPNEDFILVSEPKVVFEFDFKDLSTLSPNDQKVVEFKAIRDINGPLVLFMWWDSDMDTEGEIVLSCAPFWTYNDNSVTPKNIPWRDHWMQSIYYPSNDSNTKYKSNQLIRVEANRDEYSLWFNLFNDKTLNKSLEIQCKCGIHLFLSRTRIQMINDRHRLNRYNEAINETLKSFDNSINAIFLGDSSLLPIIAAKHKQIKKVFCLLRNKQTEDFIQSFAKTNDLMDKIQFIRDFDHLDDNSVSLVLGEPYFNSSDVPWNHLHFWYLFNSIPKNIFTEDIKVLPKKAVIKAIPIEFDNLWRIHAEVGSDVEGFDLSIYDQLIQKAMSLSDPSIESQPLWEYPGKAIAEKAFELFCFDLQKAIPKQKAIKTFVKFDINSYFKQLKTKYISIAFWTDFYLTNDMIETSGPLEPIVNGKYVNWNRHYRQGVCFLPNIDVLDKEKLLTLETRFDLSEGQLICSLRI